MTPSDDLVAVMYKLGSRDAGVRREAEETLRAQGEAGLAALLTVWDHERRREERRGCVGVAIMPLLFACIGGLFLAQHTGNTAGFAGLFGVFFVGLIGLIAYVQPTRLRKYVGLAMMAYDDPRTLLPLAQSLQIVKLDDPENRAALLNTLRGRLQRLPEHEVVFPETGYSLKWLPRRACRRIRWFWLWLELVLMTGLSGAIAHAFFGFPWYQVLNLAFTLPLVFTIMFSVAKTALREDVVYERALTPRLQRFLALMAGAAALIFLIGAIDHLVTGHPSWRAVILMTLAWPLCLSAARVIDGFALVETPALPAASDAPAS